MFVLMSSRICLKLGHLGSKTRSPGQILLKMFVLMSSRICSKLGHLVSKTRSPGQISRKLCYNHFELWSECLPWSVLDKALKVLCCSGERYRAIMALLSIFYAIVVCWVYSVLMRSHNILFHDKNNSRIYPKIFVFPSCQKNFSGTLKPVQISHG